MGVHTQRAAERALSEATAGWVRGGSGGGGEGKNANDALRFITNAIVYFMVLPK